MIDVIGSDHCARKFLDEVVFLIGPFLLMSVWQCCLARISPGSSEGDPPQIAGRHSIRIAGRDLSGRLASRAATADRGHEQNRTQKRPLTHKLP